MRVLHIANWYPNPWNDIEGNFVKAQFSLFRRMTHARLLNVQVRQDAAMLLRYRRVVLDNGEVGYYLLTRIASARAQALLTTCLLLFALLRERAWRFDLLHFHIAWPLLAHVHLWGRCFGRRMVVSEHWSGYHLKFNLPEGSAALKRMRRPFQNRVPVIAVSKALLDDIRAFAGAGDFPGFVIPNVVSLHGTAPTANNAPVLFTVNRWVAIKDPLPMLRGLAAAAEAGVAFELVVGGYGEMLDEMQSFVAASVLAGRTEFRGRMTKSQIEAQLALSDGYLFSSRYETFSVACAEALGAGVPLVGPFIPAISEYAGEADWQQVPERSPEGWRVAITRFATRTMNGEFDRDAIAASAAERFSESRIRRAYASVLAAMGRSVETDADEEVARCE